MKKLNLIIAASMLITSHAMAKVEAIYGEDNRVDVYASTNASFRELAKSTAAMFADKNVRAPLFCEHDQS